MNGRFDVQSLRQTLSNYAWQEMMTCFRFAPSRPHGAGSWPLYEGWKERNPRQGAVLLLLLERDNGLHILLTERDGGLRHHAGEISLPGGQVEGGESWEAAALRETWEEIGLPAEAVELWGRLDRLYVPPSNFLVAPFTGLVLDPKAIRPHDPEVRSIVELPVSRIFDPAIVASGEIGGRVVDFYRWQQHRIWGATARVLNNLAEALGQPCEPSHRILP